MTTDELFAKFPQLETKRLVLREFKPEHARDVFKLLSDERVTRYESRDPFTELAQAERYVHYLEFITRKKSEGIIWAISPKDQDEVIGDIGYGPHHGFNAEIGFKLRPDYWNQGLMTEAIRAVIRFLFTQTEIKRIEATTRPENLAAATVLEKNGFQKEGVMRECEHHKDQSHDLAMYSLLKREYKAG